VAKAKKKAGQPLTLRTYHDDSRDLFTSIVLVIPLFIAYQVGVLLTGGVRNGADFICDVMWLAADNSLGGYLGINLGILAAFGAGLWFLRDRGSFRPRIWPWVVLESSAYALLLGSAVIMLMSTLGLDVLLSTGGEGHSLLSSIVLSLGAGLYEEIVFRLVLMGGLFWAGTQWAKLPTWVAAVGALLLSSFVFSGVHYIGSLGDTFALGSFVFRFFAGVLLAGIFYLRGFAVAVYTHAIYDIIVMVFH
jgi:membrane protease YdiL (CAAX protease family)